MYAYLLYYYMCAGFDLWGRSVSIFCRRKSAKSHGSQTDVPYSVHNVHAMYLRCAMSVLSSSLLRACCGAHGNKQNNVRA